ncbi:WGR domain-containing protein (plasmid) [Pararobbsia alpina]|uniref:DUF6723 family protein n=1 Tax=Pararobbsia alpina TaxID=621374 RepID=UPI0039A7749B
MGSEPPQPKSFTLDDYELVTGYAVVNSTSYVGRLTVVRHPRKTIYPYDGADVIGPYRTGYEAKAAAQALGERIVANDIATPES